MKQIFLLVSISALYVCSCTNNKTTERITIDTAYIDSVKSTADSVYSKAQYTAEFAWSDYYRNSQDSTLMQIMKGKDSLIKQVIVTKNNRRIYFAQFYDNGQLKAAYEFDSYGTNNGPSKEYYENGRVREEGNYKSGFRTGEWQEYDSTGKKTNLIRYNAFGQVVRE